MNFDLSDEQQLLQDVVTRFVEDNYDLDRRTKLVSGKTGFSEDY